MSVPREMSQLNCAAFVAGVVEGVCAGCGLAAEVSAHNAGTEMWPAKTVFFNSVRGGGGGEGGGGGGKAIIVWARMWRIVVVGGRDLCMLEMGEP